MSHPTMSSDAWLKEFEEAMELADDIAARIKERDSILASKGDPTRLISATRRKVTVLGTSLDRLESLLQNPPAKPTLNEKELYRRQDMLLGIRFKTKQMAASLSTCQSHNRTNLGQNSSKKSFDTDRTSSLDTQTFTGLQEQNMGEQVERFGAMVTSTKHIALAVNEELDLQSHLLADLDEDAELASTHPKIMQNLSGLSKQASSSCCLRSLCLLLLGILVLLLIVWTVIKIL